MSSPAIRVASLGLLMASIVAPTLLPVAGCARHERSPAPIPDSTYVSVMARLSVLMQATRGRRSPLPDSVVRSARAEILRGHDVREAELLSFAEAVGDEPARMDELWSAIDARVDSLQDAGWTPPGLPADTTRPER